MALKRNYNDFFFYITLFKKSQNGTVVTFQYTKRTGLALVQQPMISYIIYPTSAVGDFYQHILRIPKRNMPGEKCLKYAVPIAMHQKIFRRVRPK